jgi:hypothetical protein
MKKITLTLVLLISTFVSFSQSIEIEESTGDNELKINMTNIIAFKWVDFTYERLINDESSFGVGILFALDDEDTGLDEYRTFSLTPYYRHFFSNKYAEGFFVEAFTMLHTGKEEYFDDIFDSSFEEKTYTDFAVGVSAGYKIVSRRGFVAEVYAGIGRDLLDKSDLEIVGRGGLSIGYRF